MSTAGTIKRRTLITGTNNPAYQVSKDAYNDALVVASAAPDGAPMIRDSTQADGWGFFTAGALGDLLHVGPSDALTALTAAAGIPYWSAPGVAPTVLTIGSGLSVVGSALTATGGGAVAGADTQVIFNDAGAYAGDAGLTYSKTTDTLTAGVFAGSGASLTNLPAANLTGILAALSGANLTALNATQLTSGTIPDARFPATLPAISGANLTNLPSAVIGATTQIAYNDAGAMAGDADLTWNKTTNVLSVTTALAIGATPATTGGLRMPNGTGSYMYARNAANSANIHMIGVATDDTIYLDLAGVGMTIGGILNGGAGNIRGFPNVTVPIYYGSAAANGDVIIEGTSHATKTTSDVSIQPTGGTISTGGVACVAAFGPAAVVSITVKNGLVTAIS